MMSRDSNLLFLALKRAEERQSFPTWVAFTLALIGGVGVICVLWWAL